MANVLTPAQRAEIIKRFQQMSLRAQTPLTAGQIRPNFPNIPRTPLAPLMTVPTQTPSSASTQGRFFFPISLPVKPIAPIPSLPPMPTIETNQPAIIGKDLIAQIAPIQPPVEKPLPSPVVQEKSLGPIMEPIPSMPTTATIEPNKATIAAEDLGTQNIIAIFPVPDNSSNPTVETDQSTVIVKQSPENFAPPQPIIEWPIPTSVIQKNSPDPILEPAPSIPTTPVVISIKDLVTQIAPPPPIIEWLSHPPVIQESPTDPIREPSVPIMEPIPYLPGTPALTIPTVSPQPDSAATGDAPVGSGQPSKQTQNLPLPRFSTPTSGVSAVDALLPRVSGLTDKDIKSLTSTGIAALSVAQVQALSSDQIGLLSKDQVSWLSSDQLKVLSEMQIAALSVAQVQSLSSLQIGMLSKEEVSWLSSDQLKALSEKQINAFTADCVVGLSIEHLKSLTPLQISSLSPEAISALTKYQVSALRPDSIATFSEEQFGALKPSQIACFSKPQISALQNSQIANLSNAQISSLLPDQIGWLTGTQRWAIKPDKISLFSSEQLNAFPNFSEGQIAAISPAQISNFSDVKFSRFSSSELTYLSGEALGALTTSEIKNITTNKHFWDFFSRLRPDQISGLPVDFINNQKTLYYLRSLSVDQLRAIQPRALSAIDPMDVKWNLVGKQLFELTETQAQALTPDQIKIAQRARVDAGLSMLRVDDGSSLQRGFPVWDGPIDFRFQIESVSSNEISKVSPEQLLNWSVCSIQALKPAQLAGLTTQQINVLGDRLAWLTDDQVKVLSTKQVGALSSFAFQTHSPQIYKEDVFKSLSPTQVAGLGSNFLRRMEPAQWGYFSRGDFSPDKISSINPQVFSNLLEKYWQPGNILPPWTDSQMSAITPQQFNSLPSYSLDNRRLRGALWTAISFARYGGIGEGFGPK